MLKGLILLDIEYSKGKPFFISRDISKHFEAGKIDVKLFTELDEKTISRLNEIKGNFNDFKDEYGKTFDIMSCVISKSKYETFHIESKGKILTHGEVAFKKITFIYNGHNIVGTKSEQTKVFRNENMSTILNELKKAYTAGYELAGTNILIADIPHIKKAIRLQYAISNEISVSQYNGHMSFISKIEENAKDIRASFINTIMEKRITSSNIQKKSYRDMFIDYCIKYGMITRRLNLRTTQENMYNFFKYLESKQSGDSFAFTTQKHNADDDIDDLAEIIESKIKALNKIGSPISFSKLNNDEKEDSSLFSKISLKDDKIRLKKEGYLIYNGNDKIWENITEKDIDNTVLYVPTKSYDDDPFELQELIKKNKSLNEFKTGFKKILSMKNITNLAELYESGYVKGITKTTIDNLIDSDIKLHGANISDNNRIGRIKYILYFFFEQQKVIDTISILNNMYKDNLIKITSYSKLFDEIKGNKKLLESFNQNKKASFDISELKKRYENALMKAIGIELLEYTLSKKMSTGNVVRRGKPLYPRTGGIYYEKKKAISIEEEYIGNDSIIYTNGNTLCLYYSFVPQNSFLYIAFHRAGNIGYKSYLYNGIQYDYYLKILNDSILNGSIGSSVWKHLRGKKSAIASRGNVRSKGAILNKTRYFERLTGEKNVNEKYEEGIRHYVASNADDENIEMTDSNANRIAGNLYVRAFMKEASSIRRKK